VVVATSSSKVLTIVLCIIIGVIIGIIGFSYVRAQTRQPQNCVLEPWPINTKTDSINYDALTWGSCSLDCAGGYEYTTRQIKSPPQNGGLPCDPNEMILSRSCNNDLNCYQDCIPADPNTVPWVPCPACLQGNAQPYEWKIVPPLQTATYGGQDCDINTVFYSRPCTNLINACAPNQDCVYGIQTISQCSVPCNSGTQIVYSTITSFSSGNGAPCNYEFLVRTQSCFINSCSTCDTLFPTNGTWTQCSTACGPGLQVQFRDPTGETYDGLCPFFRTSVCEIVPCENLTCEAPSVDEVQSLCYLSCSGFPLPNPIFPSGVCSTTAMFTALCDSFNGESICVDPQDCSVSSFSNYSDCSLFLCNAEFPLGGVQTSVRNIVQTSTGGGLPCTDPQFTQIQQKPCNNQVNVSWSEWDSNTNLFTNAVMLPQCVATECSYSAFYPITTCSSLCATLPGVIVYQRSITVFPSLGFTCSTDPAFYVSTSSCVNSDPCESCTFQPFPSITDVQTFCPPTASPSEFYIQYPLLLAPSNFGPCGFPTIQTCSTNTLPLTNNIPAGIDSLGNWRTNSCGAYAFICSNNLCPLGCNALTCSGIGIAYGSFQDEPFFCSCTCPPWSGGPACEVQPSVSCPVGPESGLVCNGVGICSYTSATYNQQWEGFCICPNMDTTPDCTDQATSWCWLYANLIFTTTAAQTNYSVPVRKLLGALPIKSNATYSFTEASCLSITNNGFIDPALMPPDTSISVYTPSPITGQDQILNNTYPLNQIQFSALIQSQYPQTMDLNKICTPDPYLISLLELTLPSLDFTQFYSRILPGSFPTICETLLDTNYFIPPPNKINITSTFSAESFQPVISGPILT
jgi:hypothetical protein